MNVNPQAVGERHRFIFGGGAVATAEEWIISASALVVAPVSPRTPPAGSPATVSTPADPATVFGEKSATNHGISATVLRATQEDRENCQLVASATGTASCAGRAVPMEIAVT